MAKPKKQSEPLKGWQQIATFLGLPISSAQRWAKSGEARPQWRDAKNRVRPHDAVAGHDWMARAGDVYRLPGSPTRVSRFVAS
jgi:hypothetical protein